MRVGLRRLGAIAIADKLEDAFALIDLLAQHRAEVAGFGAENLLPDRLVTEEGKRVGGELAAAPEFAADSGNKDEWKRSHEDVIPTESPSGKAPTTRICLASPKRYRARPFRPVRDSLGPVRSLSQR